MAGSPDVVVLGGGVIGGAVAYYLSAAGARVTVVERDRIGSGASGAAAGMLAPLAESSGPGAFLDLALASLEEFPRLVPQLREECGVDPELRQSGLLRLALEPEQAASLRAKAEALRSLGHPVQWLEPDEVRDLEPEATSASFGALYSESEGHVRSPRLVTALFRSASQRGTTLLEGEAAQALLRVGDRVTGVRTARRDLSAGHVVVAAGAWSGLLAESLGLGPVPVQPVRGQIALLREPAGRLRRMLLGGHGYIVPKPDGSVILGATVERAGFDARVTAEGMASMLKLIPKLAPGLSKAEFVRGWAGLRPGTPDGLPILGPTPTLEGLTLAAGHFRNGILLSPATGRKVAEWVLSGKREAQPNPFAIHRFDSSPRGGSEAEIPPGSR